MGPIHFATICFPNGAKVSENMGTRHIDISQKVGNSASSDPESNPFEMDSRAGNTVGSPESSGPEIDHFSNRLGP